MLPVDTFCCKYPSLDTVWCNTDSQKAMKTFVFLAFYINRL